jgi:hypothetical protein
MSLCSASNIVFNTLGDDAGGGDWVQTCSPGPSNCYDGSYGPLADQFTAGGGTYISDVQVVLSSNPQVDNSVPGPQTAVTSGPGPTSVDLFSSVGGGVGAFVANVGSVADTALTGTAANFDFSGLNIAVTAGTKYWIQLSAGSGTSAVWEYSNGSPDGTNGVVGTTGNQYMNGSFQSGNTGPYPDSGGAYLLQVTESAPPPSGTPEPSAALLVGGALMALGLVRRKKTQAL